MGLNWFILLFRVTGLRVCTCVTVMRLNWLILLFRITGLRVCILRLILISGQCTLYLFLNIVEARLYLCAKGAAPTSVNNNNTMWLNRSYPTNNLYTKAMNQNICFDYLDEEDDDEDLELLDPILFLATSMLSTWIKISEAMRAKINNVAQ